MASASVTDCLARPGTRVHMAGICGVGMAGLARLLQARGFAVSGCDLVRSSLADWLEANGIPVTTAHDPAHVNDADWLIRSAAVPETAPEIAAAVEKGIPVFARGTVLPHLLAGATSVAVGGTHGKTTTSAFIAQMLRHAGRDPGWCIGGDVPALGGVAGLAPRSSLPAPPLVVEADESDGTLALYAPDVAVVTNIEFDHMEHFDSIAAFEQCFTLFMENAGAVICCADDPCVCSLVSSRPSVVSYGMGPDADIRGVDLDETPESVAFTVEHDGQLLGRIELPVAGHHNAVNALGAVAVGLQLGLSFDEIRAGLAGVCLPRRRLERVIETGDLLVISDYAHHPSEIAALVRTAQLLPHQRLLAVFQPHRYTRTLALGAHFPAAFQGVDPVVLVPVYPASEAAIPGGTTGDLYAHFRAAGAPAILAQSLEQAEAFFASTLRPGDLLLVVGAGDVEQIAYGLRETLQASGENQYAELSEQLVEGSSVRLDEPLGSRTTFGVGGNADVYVEVGSEADLATVLRFAWEEGTPFTFLGAGSNVLVSDLGVRGITARLTGDAFKRITRDGDTVQAGSAVPLAKLLDWLEEHELAGLEFLEGIPGSVGGAVRMNAGAADDCVGAHVVWVRVMDLDGTVRRLDRFELDFAYRSCEALRGTVILEAGFSVSAGSRAEVGKRRHELAERRAWMTGLRSAGSVFRNPGKTPAGRLIEEAGLKGARIGGASVTEIHGNIIATDPDACASDVLALMDYVRIEVERCHGITLENEIVLLR